MNDTSLIAKKLPKAISALKDSYLVSICIPTYNRINDLKKCLDPILSAYAGSNEVELVVIDNGSSDRTSEYLLEKGLYSNTNFYVRECNAGFDVNLLDCYARAKGKYVHFLGNDDVLLIKPFEAVLERLKDEGPDLVISNYRIGTQGQSFNVIKKPESSFDCVEDVFSFIGHHITFMSCITLKREPVTVQAALPYVNFKFMHISLILETLAGKKIKALYLDEPVSLATDKNPATYDVAEYFLNDLIRSFALNRRKLRLQKLHPFFVSVMSHCIGCRVSLPVLLCNNQILRLGGYRLLFNPGMQKSLLRTIVKSGLSFRDEIKAAS